MLKKLNFNVLPSNEHVFKNYEPQEWRGHLVENVIDFVRIGEFGDESLNDHYRPLGHSDQFECENEIQFRRVIFRSEDVTPRFEAELIIVQKFLVIFHIEFETFDFYDSNISYAVYESFRNNETFLVELTFFKNGKTLRKYLVVK